MKRAVVMGLVGLLAFSALAGVSDAGAGSKGPKVCKKAITAADSALAHWQDVAEAGQDLINASADRNSAVGIQELVDAIAAQGEAATAFGLASDQAEPAQEKYERLRAKCTEALG